MELTIGTRDELEALDQALKTLDRLRGQIAREAEVSGWSGDQHLYHIALATDLALTNVAALVAGKSPRILEKAEPSALALEVLARGGYPRGESEAPRMVQPPEPVESDLLAEEFTGVRDSFEKARGLAEGIDSAPGAIEHHALGPLSAAQWLRFARLHCEHHLAILRDIEAVSAE